MNLPQSTDRSLEVGSNSSQAIRWTAIWAGAVVAMGVLAILFSAGLGTSASAVDVQSAGWLKAAGIFTGVTGVLAPLLALFVGGWVASYGAGSRQRMHGGLQGLVMWGIVAVASLWLVVSATSSIVSGVASATKEVAQASGQAVSKSISGLGEMGHAMGGMGGNLADTFDIHADDALRPVNAKLKANGKDPINAKQLEGAVRDVAGKAFHDGKVDRQGLIDSIVSQTSISRDDAEGVAQHIETQFNEAKDKMDRGVQQAREKLDDVTQQVKERATEQANAAASLLAKAFWGLFVTLMLGAAAAIGGGVAAASMNVTRQ